MSIKTVQQVLPPVHPHMVGDGFRVHNFFPSGYNMGQYRMSPFFMLDYNSKVEFSPREIPRGVGVHPHRGFETVTIAYHGKVAHHDSMGNSGIIGEGEVQWMTAASGILHKEYHEQEFSRKGGLFQMVQLWVNLPAKYKMSQPGYQAITKEQMGLYISPDGQAQFQIIAGEINGVKGPATTFSPIVLANLKLQAGAKHSFELPSEYNTGLLVIDGQVVFNDKELAPTDHFALFRNDGTTITVQAEQDAIVLVLSGQPIQEPIASYGPFLMNTNEELQQAVNDFSQGKFGSLED
jgi:redox-sensitive bicupin YhaK (pirin superfamily)